MIKEKVLWNKSNTAFVRASKIRDVTIAPISRMFGGDNYAVNGWFNGNEFFHFGDFASQAEAVTFASDIAKLMEEMGI